MDIHVPGAFVSCVRHGIGSLGSDCLISSQHTLGVTPWLPHCASVRTSRSLLVSRFFWDASNKTGQYLIRTHLPSSPPGVVQLSSSKIIHYLKRFFFFVDCLRLKYFLMFPHTYWHLILISQLLSLTNSKESLSTF